MSVFSKIRYYIQTSLFSLPRSEEIQKDKILQLAQKKMCKICLCDTSLDKLQILQHTTNLNCTAHKKKYVCLDCASKITIKKCPFCRQKLSPKQNLSIILFRKFALLETMNESLKQRVANAAFDTTYVGVIMITLGTAMMTLGTAVVQGEGLAAKYGYVLNNDTCKLVVNALVWTGIPLGALGCLVHEIFDS